MVGDVLPKFHFCRIHVDRVLGGYRGVDHAACLFRPTAALVSIPRGQAEKFAGHGHRKGERETLDEVRFTFAHGVEQPVGFGGYTRP
jgi:hypothetical protein